MKPGIRLATLLTCLVFTAGFALAQDTPPQVTTDGLHLVEGTAMARVYAKPGADHTAGPNARRIARTVGQRWGRADPVTALGRVNLRHLGRSPRRDRALSRCTPQPPALLLARQRVRV